jgi:hypothetical protein
MAYGCGHSMQGQPGTPANRRLRPARNCGDHSHSVVVIPLVSQFALWIVVMGLVVLLVARTRRASRYPQSDGHTQAAMREESWHGKEVEDQDRSRQLLHLKVAIAGRIACEADVCDASELCMSLEWARRVWTNTLTSVEVSRNGKAIIFCEWAEHDPFYRSHIAPSDVQRVELDALGEVPERPLVDMMVQAWL